MSSRLYPEDGGSNVLRKVGIILPQHYTELRPIRPRLRCPSPWRPQISPWITC